MMPKGVEHFIVGGGGASNVVVRIPMMPKGVEHKFSWMDIIKFSQVRIPMMPKGVEHALFFCDHNPGTGENSDDAERR